MKLVLARSLPFVVVAAFSFHAACGDGAETTTGSTTAPAVSNGTGYDPACNEGVRDGFCNALGAVPETCECLDCVETAFCSGACSDDGTCGGEEDCTCADCFDSNPQCYGEEDGGPGPGPGPDTSAPSSTTSTGEGGAAPSSSSDSSTASGQGGAATGNGGAGGV